jgi:hypothetical protein
MSETVDTQSDVSLRAARALSHKLFGGARYRIEIGAAIGEQDVGIVNAAELGATLPIVRQSIDQELKKLESVGLLTRPKQPKGREVFLTREDSAYWTWCIEARDQAVAMMERQERY